MKSDKEVQGDKERRKAVGDEEQQKSSGGLAGRSCAYVSQGPASLLNSSTYNTTIDYKSSLTSSSSKALIF